MYFLPAREAQGVAQSGGEVVDVEGKSDGGVLGFGELRRAPVVASA